MIGNVKQKYFEEFILINFLKILRSISFRTNKDKNTCRDIGAREFQGERDHRR